jgi:hypothetical protein
MGCSGFHGGGSSFMTLSEKRLYSHKGLCIYLAILALPCFAFVSTNVPIGHWSYDDVDKLIGEGLIDGAMLTTRPVTRLEMARNIAEADDKFQQQNVKNEIIVGIIERLKKEFQPELAAIGAIDGGPILDFVKPVEDPYIKYVYAKSKADIENIRGDQFDAGSSVRMGFASRAQLFDITAFYAHLEYPSSSHGTSQEVKQIYQDDSVPASFVRSSEDKGLELVEGYGKLALGRFEIEAGKDLMWWGPGYHGSMLMSNNTEPFTMVKLSTPGPVALPWIFRGLGPFKFVWFFTQLEDDRPIPKPILSGIRINFKPHPAVEMGLSRAIIFGGEGRPKYTFGDYCKAFLGRNELLTGNKENDQLAGFDASVLVPVDRFLPAKSVKLYTDGAGEDEAGGLPSDFGWIYGAKFFDLFGTGSSDLLGAGKTDLDIEYANNHVPGKPDVFYTHSVFRAGYTYNGNVIGHFMGTDSEDLFFRLTHYLTSDFILGLQYDRQKGNLSSGPQPVINKIQIDVTKFFMPGNWILNAGYRFEKTANTPLPDNHILFLQVTYDF